MIIDFHSHILPNVDHGSKNIESSLLQILLARNAGVDIIVATPHFYADHERLEQFLMRTQEAKSKLIQAILPKQANFPQVLVGSEVLLFPGMNHMDGLHKLCIEKTNCLLVEMPYYSWDHNVLDTLTDMINLEQYQIVLAHIDRYPTTERRKLTDFAVGYQINASSVNRLLSYHHIKTYCKQNRVVALGSDIHGIDPKAYSDFARALTKLSSVSTIMENTRNMLGL